MPLDALNAPIAAELGRWRIVAAVPDLTWPGVHVITAVDSRGECVTGRTESLVLRPSGWESGRYYRPENGTPEARDAAMLAAILNMWERAGYTEITPKAAFMLTEHYRSRVEVPDVPGAYVD